jgi:nucleolar protein 56
MGVLFLLYESASGYALFEQVKTEELAITSDEVQESLQDLQRFSKMVKLKSFRPFNSAEQALENINRVSEGEITEELAKFLELNMPKKKAELGVIDARMGNVLSETMGIKCTVGKLVTELLRGIRVHFDRFIKGMKASDLRQAQLGLGHSYSRAKVKFNVHRVDNMIVQSIALLDQLDKDINTFSMRVREWYSWHFPELVKVVNDNFKFCQLVVLIKDRANLKEELLPKIDEIVADADVAKQVLAASKMSMGTDISPIDMMNIDAFAVRVVSLTKYRANLHQYLVKKMDACAPNLSALIGEQVGARLIAHAGSLTNLAKYPASTVQILGAEKALFRALKSKGNTPKYGLIFHSSFIGRAKPKNKGRISRYLANKCSLASRIDCFSEVTTNLFGNKLRDQVEERLEFYKSGKAPRKNLEVMQEAVKEASLLESDNDDDDEPKKAKKEKKSKKDKKRKAEEAPEAEPAEKKKKSKKDKAEATPEPVAEPEKKKKSKKDKKAKE